MHWLIPILRLPTLDLKRHPSKQLLCVPWKKDLPWATFQNSSKPSDSTQPPLISLWILEITITITITQREPVRSTRLERLTKLPWPLLFIKAGIFTEPSVRTEAGELPRWFPPELSPGNFPPVISPGSCYVSWGSCMVSIRVSVVIKP